MPRFSGTTLDRLRQEGKAERRMIRTRRQARRAEKEALDEGSAPAPFFAEPKEQLSSEGAAPFFREEAQPKTEPARQKVKAEVVAAKPKVQATKTVVKASEPVGATKTEVIEAKPEAKVEVKTTTTEASVDAGNRKGTDVVGYADVMVIPKDMYGSNVFIYEDGTTTTPKTRKEPITQAEVDWARNLLAQPQFKNDMSVYTDAKIIEMLKESKAIWASARQYGVWPSMTYSDPIHKATQGKIRVAGPEPGEASWVPGTPLSERQLRRYGVPEGQIKALHGNATYDTETKQVVDMATGSPINLTDITTAARVLAEETGIPAERDEKGNIIGSKHGEELIKEYLDNPNAEKFKQMPDDQLRMVRAAALGGSEWAIAPTETEQKYGEASRIGEKISSQKGAVNFLEGYGLIDEDQRIKDSAWAIAINNKDVRQALRNLFPEREITTRLASAKALKDYQSGVAIWISDQISSGQAKNKKEAAQQLAEIQSGRYLIPGSKEGEFVPTYRAKYEKIAATGLTPNELREIWSGKYKVRDPKTGEMVPTTKAIMDQDAEIKRAIADAPNFLKKAYEKGGVEAYNAAVAEYNSDLHAIIYYTDTPLLLAKGQKVSDALAEIRGNVSQEFLDRYSEYIRPDDIGDQEWEQVRHYVKPWGVQIKSALEAGVSEDALKKASGLDDKSFEEAKWIENYSDANWFKRQQMLVQKSPGEYAKAIGGMVGELVLLSVPALGSEYMRQNPSRFSSTDLAISAVTDLIVVVPEIKAISAAVKGGATFERALLQSGLRVARGTVNPLIHPIETVKALYRTPVNLAKMIKSSKNQPLAAVYRGTYEDGWAIAKVLAGDEAEALATRKAMEAQFRLITEGKATSGSVIIPSFGEIKFSSSGIQKKIPDLVFTATPFSQEFKGGVAAKGEGIFTATQGLLGLEKSTATGKSVAYVFKGDKLVGSLNEVGQLVDTHGKVRGGLKTGQTLIDIRGSRNLRLAEGGKVTDKAGVVIGQLKNGSVVTEDSKLIGKYYEGATEWIDGVPATINKDGMLEAVVNVNKEAEKADFYLVKSEHLSLEEVLNDMPKPQKGMTRLIRVGKDKTSLINLNNKNKDIVFADGLESTFVIVKDNHKAAKELGSYLASRKGSITVYDVPDEFISKWSRGTSIPPLTANDIKSRKAALKVIRNEESKGGFDEFWDAVDSKLEASWLGNKRIPPEAANLDEAINLVLKENKVGSVSADKMVGVIDRKNAKFILTVEDTAAKKAAAAGSKTITKLIGPAPEKTIGFIPEGSKVYGDISGKAVGKVKSQGAFVMIRTNGVNELPDNIADARNMSELEAKAWKAFASGENSGDLYPVFKQYRKWIEDEGILPKGTRLIPVLDESGKPFMMKTTDEFGRVIEMPMLQLATKDWFQKSVKITEKIKELSKAAKPKMKIGEMIAQVEDLPKARKVAPKIVEWFRKNPKARLVGSTIEYLYTAKHRPGDMDMGAPNPQKAAEELADIIRKESGADVKIKLNKDGSARLEYLDKKTGLETEIANIKFPGGNKYPTAVIDGVQIETPAAQVQRTFDRMMSDFSGKGYTRWERFARALGGDIDIGIGAKPPSTASLRKLQARGIWNTVRDIFKPGLQKIRRVQAAETLAPDLVKETKRLISSEERLADLRREYAAAQRSGARITSKSFTNLANQTLQEAIRHDKIRAELEDRAYTRGLTLSTALSRVPADARDKFRAYAEEINRMYRVSQAASYPIRSHLEKQLQRARELLQKARNQSERAEIRNEIRRLERQKERIEREKTETPERPRGPRTPERGETPRTPETPELPRTPRTPDTPERPRVPRTPETPDRPRIPRVPRVPEKPRRQKPPKPKLDLKNAEEEAKREAFRGATTWAQGALGQDENKKVVYIAIKEPYKSNEDVGYFIGEPPPGAIEVKDSASAFETIQQITGKPFDKKNIRIGIMTATVTKPGQSPGKKGAIKFTLDPENKIPDDLDTKQAVDSFRGSQYLRRGPTHTSEISLARNPKYVEEGLAIEAEKAEKEKDKPSKIKVVKVKERAGDEERGKPLAREATRTRARAIITAPKEKGRKKERKAKLRPVGTQRGRPALVSQKVNKIFVTQETATGNTMLSRRPLVRKSKRNKRK